MTTLTQKSAFLRHNSDLDRAEFLTMIVDWLSGNSNVDDAKYALFLDVKNIEKLLTIVFSPEAMAIFDIPEDMATIDVIGLILELLETRISEAVAAQIAAGSGETAASQDTPVASISNDQLSELQEQIAQALSVEGPSQETLAQWGRDGVEAALADAQAEIHRLRDELSTMASTPPQTSAAFVEAPADLAALAPVLFEVPQIATGGTSENGASLGPGAPVKTLLPENARREELALETVMAERLIGIENPIYALWNVNTCPEHLLPWLAWAFSVEVWDASWPVTVKRQVIRNSLAIHRIKGTKRSIELALQALGMRIDLHEWFELDEDGQRYGGPHTFVVEAVAGDVFAAGFAVDENLRRLISEMIHTVKPVRTHFTLRIGEARHHTAAMRWGARRSKRDARALRPVMPTFHFGRTVQIKEASRTRKINAGTMHPSLPVVRIETPFGARGGFRTLASDARTLTFTHEEAA